MVLHVLRFMSLPGSKQAHREALQQRSSLLQQLGLPDASLRKGERNCCLLHAVKARSLLHMDRFASGRQVHGAARIQQYAPKAAQGCTGCQRGA